MTTTTAGSGRQCSDLDRYAHNSRAIELHLMSHGHREAWERLAEHPAYRGTRDPELLYHVNAWASLTLAAAAA